VVAAAGVLAAIFVFRLLYALSTEFFFEDESQIFLMGLRYHATGAWPYFGADVVWTKSEIPGALQALLVGIPLNIVPVPEAPYVLLAVLSLAALVAFAWYIRVRLPGLPAWLVLIWLTTLPWTLEFSNIINTSYLLPGSIVFFIGFFEAVPVFRRGKIPVPLAFALMGAAAAWVFQIHMSWALLPPYVAIACLSGWRDGWRALAANILGFIGGALVTGSLVIPTFVVYGTHGFGGTARNLQPHFVNPYIALSTLARIFSFASFEIWRFLATETGKREMLLLRHLWIVPLAAVVWLAGLWQPVWMLREWFRQRSPYAEWNALKWLVVGTVGIIYAGYCVVLEPSQAHAFYVVAPVAFMFAAYCWTFVDSPRWRRIAAVLLAVNVVFHAGQAWIQAPQKSLYRNREAVATAVRLKQPEMFAHRRAFAVDGGPIALDGRAGPYDVLRDIQVSDVSVTLAPGADAVWTFTLRNASHTVAYRDIHYRTHYLNERGEEVKQEYDYIKDIFQPDTTTTVELIDGFVKEPFVSTRLEVFAADALLPLPRPATP
jgi:hypothetical protein